jgi:hypothetical protein
MGLKLREFVEFQLILDLNHYVLSEKSFNRKDVNFDWSESCVEGHDISYLDGKVENFSNIAVCDLSNNLIAHGWMEFIEIKKELKVFWWFLFSGDKYEIQEKHENEIPPHVWDVLDSDKKNDWFEYRPRIRKLP